LTRPVTKHGHYMVLQVNMALMHQNTFIKDVCRKDNQKRRKTISVTQATTADPHHSTQPAQYIGMVPLEC